ncbi:MAG: metallophosphoesterase family protein [Akkermansia sp.]
MIRHYTPAAGAKVRIISDLHYGHEKCQAPAPRQLLGMMQGVDVLIVAGDLAETRISAWQARGTALREEMRQCCRDAGIKLIEIAGNHDPDIPDQMLSLWGGQVIVIHGHQLFDEIAPWGWEYLDDKQGCKDFIAQFPERSFKLSQRLQLAQQLSERVRPKLHRKKKFGIKLIDHALHCFWPPQRPINILMAWATAAPRAERFAKTFCPDCDIIVFGHCHRLGKWKKGKRQLFTTGAWFKHAEPAFVDLIDGQIVRYAKIS